MPIPGTPTVGGPSGPPVSSTDLVVRVTPQAGLPSVLVRVDFTQRSGTSAAVYVTVTRTSGGVSETVRGMDLRFAPRGVLLGIDVELPLSVACSWQATCFDAAGAVVAVSAAAATSVPRDRRLVWLVSPTRPVRSVPLIAEQYPQWPLTRNVGSRYAIGAPFAAVSPSVRRIGDAALSVHTQTVAEMARLQALLDVPEAEIMLRPDSYTAGLGEGDTFVAVGDAVPSWAVQNQAWRTWSLALTRVVRPATTGSVVALPGRTFAEALPVAVSSLSGRIVDYAGT